MDNDVIVIDLETWDAGEMFRHGPDFVRLAGLLPVTGEPIITTDIPRIVREIRGAGMVVGHNVIGFDLVALSRYHGLDIWPMARDDRIIDTMILAQLADPPSAKMNSGQSAKHYKLDSVGYRLLNHRKHGDLSALAKKHGGYGLVPVDDPEFVEYLRGDLVIPRDLLAVLPVTDYARREHKVAAIASQMTLNGMRVDLPLLEQRYAAGEQRKAELREVLHDRYGMPRTTKDGKPAKAPWSTTAGKEAIGDALVAAGLPYAPRTRTGQVALGSEIMGAIKTKFADNAELIELAEVISDLQGVRSIYGTVRDHLVGDRVHPTIQMRQASGRWSTTHPGMTVFGKHGGRVHERAIMLPEPGHVLLSFDLAQMDARAVAVHSQDHAYMDLFQPGKDLWTELATQLLGDPGKRQLIKPIGHGSNYGMGPDAIEATYGIDRGIIDRFFEERRNRFPRLIEWQNEVRERAEAGELLDNGFGRMMRPDPERAYTQGPALMGQGTTRDILAEGLLRLVTRYPGVLPLLRLQVHDEIVLSCPIQWARDLERAAIECLSFKWAPPGASRPIQIVADMSKRGAHWAACYEK